MRQQRSSPVLLFSCIALSVALGSVALALDRQYHRWFDAKHGFDAKALWTFCARLPEGAKPTDFVQRREALRHRLQAVLPVAAIGTTNRIPLQGEATIDPIRVEGRDRPGPMAAWRIVGAGYFEAAGTRLLRGSNFDHATRSSAAVIVSERVAREVFPAGDALGSRLIVSTPGGVIRAPIVGIAENARSKNLDGNPPLLVYVSDMAFSSHEAFFLVRMKESRANPGDLIRHEVHQAGLLMPYDRVLPMAGVMNEVATPHRLPVIWFMLAAGVGLLANCLGVFSLVHFEANRRVLELGVCIAMGATRRQAAMRLLRAMIGPIASGLAVGAVLAVAGLASLDLLLPPNRAVWKGVAGVAITAALAALVPTLRAVHADPTAALRNR